ncbi:MAG TPA: hypothetical protein PK761_01550 [Clostridia bacterium]|nr:hypothetical protein [Clostridia bacterium]HOR89134.1 hypothetical protein [Clostridia bacterium]HPL07574.1 hypothetical protein [Clostridia bacterium]
MKAWVIRPKPHNINRMKEFLSEQIVAIGWPDIETFEGKSKKDIKAELSKYDLDYSENQLNIATYTVNSFVNNIKINDIVIVPDNKYIYFCKIVSDYYYNELKANPSDGYPHQRKVEWIKEPVKRKDVPVSLRASLRAIRTLFEPKIGIGAILDFIDDESTKQQTSTVEEEYVEIDYPVRLNAKAFVRVPKDITQREASRLGDFVKTIYFNRK